MNRVPSFTLVTGLVLIFAGSALAGPKPTASAAKAEGATCQAGVGKPYVMPLFAEGSLVSSCEIGNAEFFNRASAMPSRSAFAAASVSGCCGSEAKVAASGEKQASVKSSGKASCCAEKVAEKVAEKSGCCAKGEQTVGKKDCEIGNRHFFTASSCSTCNAIH